MTALSLSLFISFIIAGIAASDTRSRASALIALINGEDLRDIGRVRPMKIRAFDVDEKLHYFAPMTQDRSTDTYDEQETQRQLEAITQAVLTTAPLKKKDIPRKRPYRARKVRAEALVEPKAS